MTEQQLAKRVADANEAYRNSKPIMSDAAYDALEDQLRALNPNHPHFRTTGAAPAGAAWPKVKHPFQMRSLGKINFDAKYTPNPHHELYVWWGKIGKMPLFWTEKMDGISVRLTYENGVLTEAATRGDGHEGFAITRNVLLMRGAVRQLPPKMPDGTPTPAIVHVRGEICLKLSDFKDYFPGGSNPRNVAAGTAKRLTDPAQCKHLTVFAYQMQPDGMAMSSKAAEINTLDAFGFTLPNHGKVLSYDAMARVYDTYISTTRKSLDWEIDGIVIEVDDRDLREGFGYLNDRPAGAVAFKFPNEEKETILRDITWQVGKSGRITPVALFDSVPLAGANVKRASLHNIGLIEDLAHDAGISSLCIGDTVMVARRNDVIPQIEAVLKANGGSPLATPTTCPECSTPLVRKGAYLICPAGDTCPAQISGAIKRWISKVGVKHFGTSLIDMLCETGTIESIADLYKLDPKVVSGMDMNGRKVGGTADRGFKSLHAHRVIPLHVFVGSLGIEMIGRTMAKSIVDAGFDSLNAMSKAKIASIAAIPGMGAVRAQKFCDGFWDLLDRSVIPKLLVHITIAAQATGAFSGKTVCMTGFRDTSMAATIEAQGGTIKSGVSKTLSVLVAKDTSSSSGKAAKARKYGIEVVGIDEMWNRLGGKP